MAAAAILNLKKSIFCYMAVIGFNIWCSVPNFIKIGRFLTEIWRFIDFQNSGRPPSWILKICSFSHVALVDIPLCFLKQNFAEIGQSVDELWPKKRFWWNLIFEFWMKLEFLKFKMAAAAILNLKNFNFWSRDCNRVQYLMQCTKFHQNRTIFDRDMAI